MRLIAGGIVAALVATVMSTGAAYADVNPDAPVTANDSVTLTVGSGVSLNVLANDTDPNGNPMKVCGTDSVPSDLEVDVYDNKVEIGGFGDAGVYTFTYWACDFATRTMTPGTVTVTLKPQPPVKVVVRKSSNRPGQIKVINRGDFKVHFEWGSYKAHGPDGDKVVRAHHSLWVHVRRPSLIWFAFNDRLNALKIGIIRGITLPKGVHALPPGAPSGLRAGAFPRWASPARVS